MKDALAPIEAVIGLEVHAQLRTRTKLFCSCPTDFSAAPNSQVCPTCLGLPGALPVLNDEAVGMAIRAGLAMGCEIAPRAVFARKHYFYPDLPKGYQISQFDRPLSGAGALSVEVNGRPLTVRINHIHMEEDAGRSIHTQASPGHSHIDLNRASIPLIEIVSEPDMHSPDEALAYLRELRLILLWIGVCDGSMERGSLRCDANISVRPRGETSLGTRCELKNLNSFRSLHDSIAWEIKRQSRLLRSRQVVTQETRLWNAQRARTEVMRSKEDAHDYRYLPDPDLLPVRIPPERIALERERLPELPASRRRRLRHTLGVSPRLTEALCEHPPRALAFEAALGPNPDPKRARGFADFLYVRAAGTLKESRSEWSDLTTAMPELLALYDTWRRREISNQMLSDILSASLQDPRPLSKALPAIQRAQESSLPEPKLLLATVERALREHPDKVLAWRNGQKQLTGFFMGELMKALRGHADARALKTLLLRALSENS